MLRTLGRLLLAVALVVAAQGALEHPLAHLDAATAAGSPQAGVDEEHHQDLAHPCDACVSFTSLAGLPGASAGLRPDTAPGGALRRAGAEELPRAPSPFFSHAPPSLS
jgi:hypothetical protein